MEVTDYTMRIERTAPRQQFIEAASKVLQQALLAAGVNCDSGRITLQYNRRGTGSPDDPVRYVIKVEQSTQLAETVLAVVDYG